MNGKETKKFNEFCGPVVAAFRGFLESN